MSAIYRERAQMYARADYYAWAARRRDAPTGNDPMTGEPLISWKQFDRALGAASYAAMARVSYAAARSFPVPPALGAGRWKRGIDLRA